MKDFRAALRHLEETCPHMRRVVAACGRPRSRKRDPGFATLVRIIVDQQVSVQAGAAIWSKLETGLGAVTPSAVLAAGADTMRGCGLSRPKAGYVLGIAEAIETGRLNLAALSRRSDDRVRAELMELKGIGLWTADIYLMFALGRPDIMPSGDNALQAAAGRLLGYPQRPSQDALTEIAERWRPYRSVAALMLWHAYKKMPADT